MLNFHVGPPKNPCEWRCFGSRRIITSKAGVTEPLPDKPRLIQHLQLKWWIGISGRRRPWFFGLMIWRRQNE